MSRRSSIGARRLEQRLAAVRSGPSPRPRPATARAAGAPTGADTGTPTPPPLPPYVRHVLGRLRLLHDVPFRYLVPDARLLPDESIRFFVLDRAWLDELLAGATAVGTGGSREAERLDSLRPQ